MELKLDFKEGDISGWSSIYVTYGDVFLYALNFGHFSDKLISKGVVFEANDDKQYVIETSKFTYNGVFIELFHTGQPVELAMPHDNVTFLHIYPDIHFQYTITLKDIRKMGAGLRQL